MEQEIYKLNSLLKERQGKATRHPPAELVCKDGAVEALTNGELLLKEKEGQEFVVSHYLPCSKGTLHIQEEYENVILERNYFSYLVLHGSMMLAIQVEPVIVSV